MNDERRLTPPPFWTHAAVCVLCVAAALFAGRAHAEEHAEPGKPRAILLDVGGPAASAAPMNAIIHTELEELHVVTIVAALGMDLAAVQLSLDCVAETPRCLKAVAAQERAQVLISPTLQRLPDALLLSILRFDTRQGELRRVTRRQSGASVGPELLDSVPNMLRELFDLPPLEPPAVAKKNPPPTAAPAREPAAAPAGLREARGLPAGPLVLAGAGAVSLAAAVSVGAMMKSTQKDYDRIRSSLDIEADAQAAADARARGQTEATVANVLFAVGGGALASGIVWLAFNLNGRADKDSTTLSLRPVLTPSHLGVVLMTRGVGL